jgi:hypothetical protein
MKSPDNADPGLAADILANSSASGSRGQERVLHLVWETGLIAPQTISGDLTIQVLARSRDSATPATLVLHVSLISRNRKTTLATLVPAQEISRRLPDGPLQLARVGPIAMTPHTTAERARILIEVGAEGAAQIEPVADDWAAEFSSDLLPATPPELRNRRIGRCIYCGATDDLTREHIIPYGLNGYWTLSDASCPRCRKTTSAFETEVLRNTLGWARSALNMQTRNPEDRIGHLPIRAVRRGRQTFETIELAGAPILVYLPTFAAPGTLTATPGMTLQGPGWLRQLAGPPFHLILPQIARDRNLDEIYLRIEYQPIEFARTLAKIAFGLTVLSLGSDALDDVFVLPVIHGDTSRIREFVGSREGIPNLPPTGLHAFEVHRFGRYIHVHLHLFAQFEAPEYHVVVGRLK